MEIKWNSRPSPMNNAKAKEHLLTVKEVLDSYNIEFWLIFGTCLGAVREGDFITYDFDIDIGIRHKDLVPKLNDLDREFKERKFDTHMLSAPYDYNRMLKLQKNDIRIDLVNFDSHRDYYYHTNNPNGLCHVFTKELFDNLKEIDFIGTKFKVPKDAGVFLEILYGKDWRTPSVYYDYRTATSLVPKFWQNVIKK